MQETPSTNLPLPTWCFVLLGVPTFTMPLAYLAFAVWCILGILAGEIGDMPDWLMHAISPAYSVTFAMWPIYVAWVGLSTRLAWREKAWWIAIVILLNMVGMPMFYVFMIRRYLGLEGRTGKRDDVALVRFLHRHAVRQDRLSSTQLMVLKAYCRRIRLATWGTAPMMIAVAALWFYMAVVFVPQMCIRLFPGIVPYRTLIIDSATGSEKVIAPDPEVMKLAVYMMLGFGATAGMLGTMGLLAVIQVIFQQLGQGHKKALIEFLKATGGQQTHANENPHP